VFLKSDEITDKCGDCDSVLPLMAELKEMCKRLTLQKDIYVFLMLKAYVLAVDNSNCLKKAGSKTGKEHKAFVKQLKSELKEAIDKSYVGDSALDEWITYGKTVIVSDAGLFIRFSFFAKNRLRNVIRDWIKTYGDRVCKSERDVAMLEEIDTELREAIAKAKQGNNNNSTPSFLKNLMDVKSGWSSRRAATVGNCSC